MGVMPRPVLLLVTAAIAPAVTQFTREVDPGRREQEYVTALQDLVRMRDRITRSRQLELSLVFAEGSGHPSERLASICDEERIPYVGAEPQPAQAVKVSKGAREVLLMARALHALRSRTDLTGP